MRSPCLAPPFRRRWRRCPTLHSICPCHTRFARSKCCRRCLLNPCLNACGGEGRRCRRRWNNGRRETRRCRAQPVPQCLRGKREEVQGTMEQREEGDAPAPRRGRVVRRASSRTIATFRVRDLMGWRPATSPIQRSISCFRRIQRLAGSGDVALSTARGFSCRFVIRRIVHMPSGTAI
jgi:hypothetical protein